MISTQTMDLRKKILREDMIKIVFEDLKTL